jgi:hypothetical protein
MTHMKTFRTLLAVVAVTLIATHTSFGGPTTPEIDPGLGVGALAFLGGAIMVIRGRRKA